MSRESRRARPTICGRKLRQGGLRGVRLIISNAHDGIKAAASNWLMGVGATPTVSVCYGQVTTCTNDTDAAGATNSRGQLVTVTVTANVGLAAPSLLGMGPFTLSATATMLVNN